MDKPLSPRVFLIRFTLIWLTGLIPAGFLAFAFARDQHPFAPAALAIFLILAAGGYALARAAFRALYPSARP